MGTSVLDFKLASPSALARLREDYNPDEPRDEMGRWTSGGGAVSGPPFTQDERDAVDYLTGPSYQVLNPWLRGEGPPGENTTWARDTLNQALATHQLTQDSILYRGVLNDPTTVGSQSYWNAAPKDLQPGDTIRDPAFLSTSYDPAVGGGHGNDGKGGTVFVINTPAGTPAINVSEVKYGPGAVPQFSGKSMESPGAHDALKEVILPRDLPLTVTSVEGNTVHVSVGTSVKESSRTWRVTEGTWQFGEESWHVLPGGQLVRMREDQIERWQDAYEDALRFGLDEGMATERAWDGDA